MAEISTLNGYKIKDKKAIRYYNTVADMKADITLKDGMHIKTKGYYAVNDGGGADYHITNTQSESDHQELLNNNLYASLLLNNNICTPEQFGAKGDGVTDDTSAIASVFNSEKTVYLINNYKTGAIIINNKTLDVHCNGKVIGTKFTFNDCTGYFEMNGESNGTDNFVTFEGCDNIKIRGTYKNAPRNCLVVSDCNDVDVSVSIYNSGLSGLYLVGYNENPKGANIHDCYVEDSGQLSGGGYNNAIYVNSNADQYHYEQVNINNCVCINSGCGGIFISADYSNVSNCCVDTTGLVTQQTAIGIWIHDCQHVNVSNCEIKNSARDGIQTDKAGYINISNCIAKNSLNCGFKANYDATESGRYYGEEANKNITFNSCIAIDSGLYGNNTFPGFNVTSVKNVSLINCMVNCTGDVKSSRGVLGTNPENLVIVGCIFTNTASNTGTTVVPSVGYWIDGNGPHFNMGGEYKSSLANFGISSLRQTSINENSDLTSVIKFISNLCAYLEGYGFFTTSNN